MSKSIGLVDVDGLSYPNLALMKISSYHKALGDTVEWFDPLFVKPDLCYASKIFNFTEDYDYFPRCEIIKGGTGYDVASRLPDDIESCDPDYSIYDCRFSIQLFTRGCIRKCGFCVVPEKEGKIRSIEPMALNPKGEWVEVLDNNFFANRKWKEAVAYLMDSGQPVNFHGIDIRIMTDEMAEALSRFKHGGSVNSSWVPDSEKGKFGVKNFKIAWDNPRENIIDKLKLLIGHIMPYKITCYVLIGYNSTEEEDLYRVRTLHEMGIIPFVMPFNKSDPYQNRFTRWVNMKAVFKSVEWKDYK